MSYKTKYGKSEYEYNDDGNCVFITVNGKEWGSPQGDRFFRALLKDIKDLKEENEQWKDINRKFISLYGKLQEEINKIKDIK